MKKMNIKNILWVVVLLLCLKGSAIFAQEKAFVQEGRVRVKFEAEMTNVLEKIQISKSETGNVKTGINEFDELCERYHIADMQRVFPYAGKYEKKHKKHQLNLWYELNHTSKSNFEEIVSSLNKTSFIAHAEPVLKIVHYTNVEEKIVSKDNKRVLNFPNDPELSKQWFAFDNSDYSNNNGSDAWLLNAWTEETGNSDVIVAVIDGGIDIKHQDIKANLWINADEVAGNNVDDDNNGIVDDIHGYSLVSNTGNIYPDNGGHGTHVAGTVGAVTNNGIGVTGIAGGSGSGDGVRLMSCAVFEKDDAANSFANAFVYAADNGAIIAQNSWGYGGPDYYDLAILEAIDYFVANAGYDENGEAYGPMQGGLVFFAAGNNGETGNWYPACYEPVVAVASTKINNQVSEFSNYGRWVDISAPGSDIYSTIPNGYYSMMSGTSMACPQGSAAAALIVSKYKNEITPQEVWSRLTNAADPIDYLNPGYEGKIGSGRLNVFHALLETENDNQAPNKVTDLTIPEVSSINASLSWTAPGEGAENNGAVSYYDLRYSENEITEENFSEATQYPIRHALPAGETENIIVNGLHPGTTYYVALKSKDYYGNFSELSNIVQITTENAPHIEFPEEINYVINRNAVDNQQKAVTIKNSGQEVLDYSIDLNITSYFGITDENIILQSSTGTLDPDTQIDVLINHQLQSVEDGIYTAKLKLITNDPFNSEVTIPLTLLVFGNESAIELSTNEIVFEKTYTATENIKEFYIANNETARGYLEVSELTMSHADLSVATELPVYIAPGDSALFSLAYSPKNPAELNELLAIRTNDVNNLLVELPVIANSTNPPVISVEYSDISVEMLQKESSMHEFSISNIGADILNVDFIIANRNTKALNSKSAVTLSMSEILTEDFESVKLSEGWESLSTGEGWTFGNDLASSKFDVPAHGNYAVVNDHLYGSANNAQNDYLITPEIFLGNIKDAKLEFESFYTGDSEMEAYIEISEDNGENWLTIKKIKAATDWETVSVNLYQFLGKNIKIAFHADDKGLWSSGWAIDNIRVLGTPNWVDIELLSGTQTILPNETSNFRLTLNSDDIAEGDYLVNLNVLSNDPQQPVFAIPVDFKVFGNSNALLSDLTIDGTTIIGFDPERYVYSVSANGTDIPVIEALTQNPYATIEINELVSLSGTESERTATIVVNSYDNSKTKTYTVIFDKVYTGIEEQERNNQLKIYPNPFENQVTIDYMHESSDEAMLIVYNLLGEQLLQLALPNGDSKGKVNLNTAGLPKGVYLVKLVDRPNTIAVQKIIKY